MLFEKRAARGKVNHYDVLEVSPNASAEVIRAAYRSLMQRYHPDKNPGDAEAAEHAARVVQAYEVLANEDQRARYDQSLLRAATASPPAAKTVAGRARMPAGEKKGGPSFAMLLLVCALILAACWALMATVKKLAPLKPVAGESAVVRKGVAAAVAEPVARQDSRDRPAPAVAHKMTEHYYDAVHREMPALVGDFSVALRDPRDPGMASGRRLEIPFIAVRLGRQQPESARSHLLNMVGPIRQALESRLGLADYDRLMRLDGEDYLIRRIFEVVTDVAGAPTCPKEASEPNPEDCYGVVVIRLPESYVVK